MPGGLVEKIIDQCYAAKLGGEVTDFEPLIEIMEMVTEKLHRGGVSARWPHPRTHRPRRTGTQC